MIAALAGWKGFAVGGAAVATLAFTVGWKAKATLVEADHAKAMRKAATAHAEAMDALQEELEAATANRLALAAQLDAAQGNVRTVTREIIREVPKYVQDSTPDCDRRIGVDALLLLDAAARGVAPGAEGDPGAARQRDDTLSGGASPTGYLTGG